MQLNYYVVLITALHQSDSLIRIYTFLTSIHFCWIFNCLRGHFMNHGMLLRLPCCRKSQLYQRVFCKLLKRTFSTMDRILSVEQTSCSFEMTLMVFICFPSLVNLQNRGLDNVRNLSVLELKLGEILVLNMVVCICRSHIKKNSWPLPTAKSGYMINWEFSSNINMLWIEKAKTGAEITYVRANARSWSVF